MARKLFTLQVVESLLECGGLHLDEVTSKTQSAVASLKGDLDSVTESIIETDIKLRRFKKSKIDISPEVKMFTNLLGKLGV